MLTGNELNLKNERFMNNRLINKIKDEPYWTVSDSLKRPLDGKKLISNSSENFALASFKNDNWPMVTLSEINNDPRLTYTNRAYRLHAEDNRVICIDMEKTASPSLRRALKNFPVDYAETSLSGTGIHYLIEIPKDLIPEEAEYLFDDMVVVKSDDSSFEVFFNDHFVTLTKNILPPSEYTLRRTDEEPRHREKITNMLKMLADIQKTRQAANNAVEAFIPDIAYENFTPYEKQLMEEIINGMNPTGEKAARSPFKKLSDFANDYSRYELYLATSIAARTINKHKFNVALYNYDKDAMKHIGAVKANVDKFKAEAPGWDKLDITTEQGRKELAGIVYAILCSEDIRNMELLTPRKKHKESRGGIPWLMDRAVRGTGFACGIDSEKEEHPQDTNSIKSYMQRNFNAKEKKG